MEENEIIEETTTDDAIEADDFETSEESDGLLGRIIVTGVVSAVAAGGTYVFTKRDAIAAKLAEKKEQRRQKKVKKLLDKLSKLQQENTPVENKTEE